MFKLWPGIDLRLRRVASLEAQVAYLQAEKARPEAEKARLAAENAEVRRRLGWMAKTATSHLSATGIGRNQPGPALPKEKKPFGGQPGHKGQTMRLAERPNRVEVHLPERCAVCRRPISSDEPYPVVGRRQVFDGPEPRLEVTEHRLGQIACRRRHQWELSC